jgi:aspartyl protease family protein
MDGEDTTRLIIGITMIVLLAGSIAARRLPLKQYAKMILAWVAIFAGMFVIMSFRPEMSMMWDRVKGELTGAPRQSTTGDNLKLVRQDDGHFWLRASVNGYQADFMVDSGATTTAINSDDAKAAKLSFDKGSNIVQLDTANGVVEARTTKVQAMRVGDLQIDDHEVVVSDSFGDTNVVGMNFLDSFSSWNVEGDVMTLRP